MPAADRRRTTSAGWLLGLAAGLLLWTLWSSSARASGVDPTKISLPRGPASVEGLGRDFVPSLASGTASYSIDIALPPAVRGFGPRLSLDYDAGGGASELGLGWRIGGITAIRRRVAEGLPRFDASDRFELSGVGVPCDLVEVEPDHFRPRHESGAFVRVQRSTDGERWEAKLKNGFAQRFVSDPRTPYSYGRTALAEASAWASDTRPRSGHVCSTRSGRREIRSRQSPSGWV